ncbi:MAG: SpoIIE family protein phosphatase [Candidatus Obscuribacterales bacterium]|nr:SpoIIE family protein phosphatase [Candidatus Obscuribacterales bacterium]
MDVTDAQRIEVIESSQVSEARRRIIAIGLEQGLDQAAIDRLALVSTELATNLVKHATGGFLIAQGLKSDDNVGVEIFAMDTGPGMNNVEECLRDGFSTVGTLGTGLGAISRLSDSIEFSSSHKRGTIIISRLWLKKTELIETNVCGLTVPIAGEILSGDKWTTCTIGDSLYCLMVDGLGHGFEASEAAKLAVKRFKDNLSLAPAQMLKELHNALRGSRGAVGAVAKIDFERGELCFAGLGNIAGILLNKLERKHLTSLNGTLGYEAQKITEFRFPWARTSTLIMHSDGLSSRYTDYETLSGNNAESAAVVAATLYLRQSKKTDDATVLVVKQAEIAS